jgi:hypothetical protein
VSENENIVLPPKYYHEYFNYLLGFVKDKYKHILQEKEWRFLRKYYSLSEDAQCLFIRFTNRKGLFFKTNKLSYEELGSISELLDELLNREFIEQLSKKHSDYVPDLLHLSTKAEVLKLVDDKSLRAKPKPEIADWVRENIPADIIIDTLAEFHPLIKVNLNLKLPSLSFYSLETGTWT